MLRDTSPNADARSAYALVNFVLADNRALGTQTSTVDAVAARGLFYLGGAITFPGAAPIARLEPVIPIGGHQPRKALFPATSNVVIEPAEFDPGFIGDVAGELINDDPPWILDRATLSAVVFDAQNNVIGGGTGSANASSPPGTRQVFIADLGFDAIPIKKAAYAIVSTSPSYSLCG